MATAAYYPRFDLCRIDADGIRILLAAETISAYNVTAASSLGTLVSDADGMIDEGSFFATAGDIVEFSHATYPLTFRLTLGSTQDTAYGAQGTETSSYIVENLGTKTNSAIARLYIQDLDNPNVEPVFWASGRAGSSVEGFFPNLTAKNIRVIPVSVDDTNSWAKTGYEQDGYSDITIPGGTLFSHYADATTSSTSEQDLYQDVILAGTLTANGDVLKAEYAGTAMNGGDSKTLKVYFGGTALLSFATTTEERWAIAVTIIRCSASVIRYSIAVNINGDTTHTDYLEATGFDLDNNDHEMTVTAITAVTAGDLTATMGYAIRIPAAAPLVADYLTGESGDLLTGESSGTFITGE